MLLIGHIMLATIKYYVKNFLIQMCFLMDKKSKYKITRSY